MRVTARRGVVGRRADSTRPANKGVQNHTRQPNPAHTTRTRRGSLLVPAEGFLQRFLSFNWTFLFSLSKTIDGFFAVSARRAKPVARGGLGTACRQQSIAIQQSPSDNTCCDHIQLFVSATVERGGVHNYISHSYIS